MLEAIIAFVTANKIIIGAVGAAFEAIVIVINMVKGYFAKKNTATTMKSKSMVRKVISVINPINCFRKG